MTDRELLESAAKAARIELFFRDGEPGDAATGNPWDPLTDDGDALRLAVDLGMRVYVYPGGDDDYTVAAGDEAGEMFVRFAWAREDHGDDARSATRRAITRCAASYLGEQA